MNSDKESVLVLLSILFITSLFIMATMRGSRLSMAKGTMQIDKSKYPVFFKFLSLVVIVSTFLGYCITTSLGPTIQFAVLNVIISIIMGPKIFLMDNSRK